MGKLSLYIRTLRYYKVEQLFYQVYYNARKNFRKFVNYKHLFTLYRKGAALEFDEFIPAKTSYNANKFIFLNKSVKFSEKIDWEYADNGKLWANHLNYFDYLSQEDMSKARGSALMYLMVDHLPKSTIAKTPYSISVRGVNWIKFISKHGITRKTVDRYLYCQYRILLDNIAYDRMGNHLLENGFSMLFGAYYFKGYELLNEAKIVLTQELYEQILPDGGHYQLSPMYHQLMLNRILDGYNLLKNNTVYEDEILQALLKSCSEKMLGWLDEITYKNGDVPCLNDSTYGVSPSTKELKEYANRLGIESKKVTLKESGYRKFSNGAMEGIIDIGNIGPDYQTDHSHSDTFNFEVVFNEMPFIVDTGISTYNRDNVRHKERSTFSHNTVRVNNVDQSEVYRTFKVGRRAKVSVLKDETNEFVASHDGYKRMGISHQREFLIGEESLIVNDVLDCDDESPVANAFIHFHPCCEIIKVENNQVILSHGIVELKGHTDVKILDYNFALGFSNVKKAKMLQITFDTELSTLIRKNED